MTEQTTEPGSAAPVSAPEAAQPSAAFPTWQRIALVLLVVLSSIACDRATKQVAESSLPGAGRISMLGDTFRLEYAENKGAFLSLGANLPDWARGPLLTGGVAVILLFVLGIALLGKQRTRLEVASLALIASGGLGNLWDRLARGAVVDFMNLGIGPVRTGIFNVADVAIMVGLGLLLLAGRKRPARPAPAGP